MVMSLSNTTLHAHLREPALEEVGEEKDIFPFPPETELVSEGAADRFPVERVGDCMCFSMGERMETLCSGDFSLEDMV